MKNIFSKPNTTYQKYTEALRAVGSRNKFLTLFNYFLPGIVVAVLINNWSIVEFISNQFNIPPKIYQFWILIGLTFLWHLSYPIFMLKRKRAYSWKEIFKALSLDQFSFKGFFLITPLFFLLVMVVAVPFMGYIFPILHGTLQNIDLFKIPEHSIFYDYSSIYSFAPWQLALLFVGNIVGEEVYFRGYLMKKSSFLGKNNWWIHSVLFTLYHLWQIPMTYALGFISLTFGILMVWRKNLYELMLLHVLINLAMPGIVQLVFQG